jgi:hypothetical protein
MPGRDFFPCSRGPLSVGKMPNQTSQPPTSHHLIKRPEPNLTPHLSRNMISSKSISSHQSYVPAANKLCLTTALKHSRAHTTRYRYPVWGLNILPLIICQYTVVDRLCLQACPVIQTRPYLPNPYPRSFNSIYLIRCTLSPRGRSTLSTRSVPTDHVAAACTMDRCTCGPVMPCSPSTCFDPDGSAAIAHLQKGNHITKSFPTLQLHPLTLVMVPPTLNGVISP